MGADAWDHVQLFVRDAVLCLRFRIACFSESPMTTSRPSQRCAVRPPMSLAILASVLQHCVRPHFLTAFVFGIACKVSCVSVSAVTADLRLRVAVRQQQDKG